MAFKRSFTDPVPEKREQTFRDRGIDTWHGHARFSGPRSVEVAGETLEGEYVLIAAGAEPVTLDIPAKST